MVAKMLTWSLTVIYCCTFCIFPFLSYEGQDRRTESAVRNVPFCVGRDIINVMDDGRANHLISGDVLRMMT